MEIDLEDFGEERIESMERTSQALSEVQAFRARLTDSSRTINPGQGAAESLWVVGISSWDAPLVERDFIVPHN
jgi:hypothetical protein